MPNLSRAWARVNYLKSPDSKTPSSFPYITVKKIVEEVLLSGQCTGTSLGLVVCIN